MAAIARSKVIAKASLAAAVLAGLAAMAPDVRADARPSPRLELQSCQIPGVARPARCGVFAAPENWENPNGRTLPLRVVVLPAQSGHPAREPVFYFEGGPGQAATRSASDMAGAWFQLDNDVVLIDQRGTGEGHRLTCDLPGSDQNLQGYLEPPYQAYAACGRALSAKVDLTQYVTTVAMRDADAVRQALGYDRINLYGASYGSRAAIVYAKLYGSHVRSVYLSGVVPLEIRAPLYFAWSAQRALDAALAECAADADCRRDYPDPKADLEAARERLRAEPARVRVKNPATGKDEDVVLNDWAFANALFFGLYVAEAPSSLPSILRRAREGDFTSLVQGWIGSLRAGRQSMAWGMNRAIVCSEDAPRIQPDEVERETTGTFLGSAQVMGTLESCSTWPRAAYPAGFFEPFRSDIPVLITSGEFDPVTPPRWGEAARRSFPNSLHIVSAQAHSHFEETGCLGAINAQFLREGSVQGLDLSCAAAPANRLRILR